MLMSVRPVPVEVSVLKEQQVLKVIVLTQGPSDSFTLKGPFTLTNTLVQLELMLYLHGAHLTPLVLHADKESIVVLDKPKLLAQQIHMPPVAIDSGLDVLMVNTPVMEVMLILLIVNQHNQVTTPSMPQANSLVKLAH
jgi:hypothetical protein